MVLPYRVRRFAHNLRSKPSVPSDVVHVESKTREGSLEFSLVEKHNDVWKGTKRSSRLTFVRRPVISSDQKIMTIGSCFALEIRAALRQQGFDVFPKYGEIEFNPEKQVLAKLPERDDVNHYNTFTIRAEFEKAFSGDHYGVSDFVKTSVPWRKMFGGSKSEVWQDPYRKHIYAYDKNSILELSQRVDQCLQQAIRDSDVYVITLGLTEVWRNDRNGQVINQVPDQELSGRAKGFTFECSTYEQNYENIRRVCSLIEDNYPDKIIILTVSPVALKKTFTDNDVFVANMESKCTLRAVAAAISREFENVIYWPSFEIAMAKDIYKADGRHVTVEGVKGIVDQFLKVHLHS